MAIAGDALRSGRDPVLDIEMRRHVIAYGIWCLLALVNAVIAGARVIYVWPPAKHLREVPIWGLFLCWLVPIVWWEVACRRPARISLFVRVVGKFYLVMALFGVLAPLGDSLTGMTLYDYRGPSDPYPDSVIRMYATFAILHGAVMLVALSSVIWIEPSIRGFVSLYRRLAERPAWRRGLAAVLFVAALGGGCKIVSEGGPAAFSHPKVVCAFGAPLVASITGLVLARPARRITIVLCIVSFATWIFLVIEHWIHFHASTAFFSWSFTLFGWIMMGLCGVLAGSGDPARPPASSNAV